MRVTGAADPPSPSPRRCAGKLPQRKLVTTAAAGYSSYGNQIGLATGQVNEIYHPGYVAKRMEIGAVVGAAPGDARAPRDPAPGDVIILLGGRTGRDGIGGATGSSKAHNVGVASRPAAPRCRRATRPVERKLQRLFRRGEATPHDQALQRLRRGRRVASPSASWPTASIIDLDTRAQEIRRPGRHRAGHLREPGAHGRARSPPRTWTTSSATPREENLEATVGRHRHRGAARGA